MCPYVKLWKGLKLFQPGVVISVDLKPADILKLILATLPFLSVSLWAWVLVSGAEAMCLKVCEVVYSPS